MDDIRLSQILKRALKGRVLSEVAKEAGISKSLLHDWVSASRKPSGKNLPQLRKLASYLNMTLEEVLFGEPGQTSETISSTTFNDGGRTYRISIEKINKKGR